MSNEAYPDSLRLARPTSMAAHDRRARDREPRPPKHRSFPTQRSSLLAFLYRLVTALYLPPIWS